MPIMSTATEQIRVRVPAARARQVRKILAGLGTDTGGLVNMLFAQVEMRKAIPFPVATTTGDPETDAVLADPAAIAAINDFKAGKIKRWYSEEEVFDA